MCTERAGKCRAASKVLSTASCRQAYKVVLRTAFCSKKIILNVHVQKSHIFLFFYLAKHLWHTGAHSGGGGKKCKLKTILGGWKLFLNYLCLFFPNTSPRLNLPPQKKNLNTPLVVYHQSIICFLFIAMANKGELEGRRLMSEKTWHAMHDKPTRGMLFPFMPAVQVLFTQVVQL